MGGHDWVCDSVTPSGFRGGGALIKAGVALRFTPACGLDTPSGFFLVQHPTTDASLGEADIRDGNGAMGNGAKR